MHLLAQYRAAEALERHLGDPADPARPLSFHQAVALDEAEAYPADACEALYRWGFHHYYVPAALGGRLESFEEILALLRVVSRRDLAVAISDAHTFLGSVPVWIAGTEAQRQRLAAFVLARGPACLALTERHHGSDLLACETAAVPIDGGYRLVGEKWPINKATVARALTLLARTDDAGGARSLSLFLLMKDAQRGGAYRHLPKVRTLGIRSCDISGIALDNCRVTDADRIGAPGAGVELALKGFHVTRTLCAGLSLGAGDTALRTTLRFALGRRLYGRTVFDLPHARHTLAGAFADLLVSDCMATAAARGLHVAPEQFSTWSAVVKYFVPVTTEETVQALSVILGARHYFRDGHDAGVFQKVMRDNSLISLFDGSTVVNLHALILRLRLLARTRRKRQARPDADLPDRLATLFDLRRPLPALRLDRLDLLGRGDDDVLQGLPLTLAALRGARVAAHATPHLDAVVGCTERLVQALARFDAHVLAHPPESGHDQPPAAFDLARHYCRLHAAATCIHLWYYNRAALPGFFADGAWLVFSLDRLLQRIEPAAFAPAPRQGEAVAAELARRFADDTLFSIVPLALGADRAQPTPTPFTRPEPVEAA